MCVAIYKGGCVGVQVCALCMCDCIYVCSCLCVCVHAYKCAVSPSSQFCQFFPRTGLEKAPHGNDCVITEMHFLVELKENGYF